MLSEWLACGLNVVEMMFTALKFNQSKLRCAEKVILPMVLALETFAVSPQSNDQLVSFYDCCGVPVMWLSFVQVIVSFQQSQQGIQQ